MTNQPGLKMFLDKLKLILMGAPLNNNHPAKQETELSAVDAGLVLEIGNQLMITDPIVRDYPGLSNVRGRVVIIDEISANKAKAVKASAFGIQVNVDTTEARQMRVAYLAREQA
jgi:hypothetical protein